jgi:hypothetical protein
MIHCTKTTFVGLDVHKDSIVIAVAELGRGAAPVIGTVPHGGIGVALSAAAADKQGLARAERGALTAGLRDRVEGTNAKS